MDIFLAMIIGGILGLIGWRLVSGKWIPDGSFSASQSPSGIPWHDKNKMQKMGIKDE